MKKTLLIFLSLTIFLGVRAQVVALHGSAGVEFFTGTSGLTNAYNAASNGDTIYLPGGGFTTPGTFNKSLLIFGAGHYPDSTEATSKTFINGSFSIAEEADGFQIQGIDINGYVTFSYNQSANNVIFKYCKVTGDFNVSGTLSNPSLNLSIIDCIITGTLYLNNAENAGIFNSIIHSRVLASYGNLFNNNIFMFSYTGSSSYYSVSGDNNLLNNNIFLNASNRYIVGTSNQIYNCLFIVSPYYGTTAVESGNYFPVEQSSIFISQSGYTFSYDHNYHLQDETSYLGVDGTEVGLYGGIHGYKEGAVPSNPHIQWENISPTTTDGILSIEIKAAAQEK